MGRFSPEGSQTRPLQAVDAEEGSRQQVSVPGRTVVSLLLLVIAMSLMAVGMSWWVHPGAGLAILGSALYVLGLKIGNE